MSKIDKLSILGVRSFDNIHSETIAFHTPLTLIVGLNGSGKTTIIECLKYATTGDLPPGTKTNGAFVHDPKLCGEKEVMAQVKVSFKSTDQTKMVCTRNMSLTVQKNSRKFKGLEGNLLLLRDGEKVSISSRVGELNTMIPQYLGVSKAVLDSVIFCHQEDSLWPLADATALKKRFDQIFEALKYTKAIENIRILQKEQKENLIKFKKDEEHCKWKKERAETLQKQIIDLDAETEQLRNESEGMTASITEATENAKEAWNKANTAGETVGLLNGKRIERKAKEESVETIRQNLTEMSESDAELERMLEQYEERVKESEANLDVQKARYGELGKEIEGTRDRSSNKVRECGSLEAQKESYDRQVENREKLVKETARTHDIRGFDLDVDDAQVEAFMERISKMARDQNAAFERARRETREELQQAQKVLNKISEQKSALNQRKESSRQAIAQNDTKINSLLTDLNKIEIDEGGMATLESNLQDTEARLQTAKTDAANSNLSSAIETAEAELRNIEDRKDKLDVEQGEATRQAGASARLDLVQKDVKERQTSLETNTNTYGDKITSIVGQGWTPSTVEADYQRALEQSSSHVAEAEKQRDGIGREMQQLEYKLNTCRTDLKAKQAALKSAESLIRKTMNIEPADYPEEVKKLEDDRDVFKSDADSLSKVLAYLDSCLNTANEHNACKTCYRKFGSPKELEKMIDTVEGQKKKYQSDMNVKKDLDDVEQELQAARGLSSDFDEWERLKEKEIPGLQQSESEFAAKREKLIAQLEEQDVIVSDRLGAKREIEAVSKAIQSIAKDSSDITKFESQIKELMAKQKAAGLSRGMEIIQEEIKKVNDEKRSVKARHVKLTGERDRSEALVNSLELEKVNRERKRDAAEYQLKDKRSLSRQIEDYKKMSSEQRATLKSIDQEIQGLGPQLSKAQAQYEDIASRGADKDRELQDETSKLNNSLNKLKMADKEIKDYDAKGKPAELARSRRELQSLQEEVTRLEQERARIVTQAKNLENQLRNVADTKRSISDNQRYRRDLRRLEVVRAEIVELENTNVEAEKTKYEREVSRWQMERNKLVADQSGKIGSLKAKDEELKSKIDDFDSEFKGSARKFKEAHINVETTKACVDDLGRYAGALDKAVMKYHSIKMEEINRIIEELWRKTYQGTDVDTIMIRSESENVKSNKNYNYRVCMVKQDAEMDMRGRCSAGQKVLASIIIRLALAECFGQNCGVIALDEPTTNLDQDNIKSLAQSLAQIIKIRRAQRNFQLIVITHDEDFLRHMGCSEFADNYYRVSRNEKQKSIIERQSIAEVI